ncbi:MAG TPA: hypothetical protein P5267_01290 [Patescibacteria group bacterium]|nr:hypothetical protein [Patescibacteria group bacterium]
MENLTSEGVWFLRIAIIVLFLLFNGLVVPAILPEGLAMKLAKVTGKTILAVIGAAIILAFGIGLYFALLNLNITLTTMPR